MTRLESSRYKKKQLQKSQPPKSLVITLGATAILILGGGLAYFLFQNKGGSSVLPVGSQVLPVDTSSSVTLTTQADQWERFQDFNIPQTRQLILDGFNAFNREALEPQGLDYGQDIQPWIGSQITTAVLTPKAQGDETLADISKSWILPIRNVGLAQNFITQGLSRGGASVNQTVYQGIEVKSIQSQSEVLFLAMIEKDYLVLANDLPSLREIIDTALGDVSLATQDRFKSAMSEIKASNPLAQIYWNVPANTSQIFEQEGRQIDQSTLERLQEFQGLGSVVALSKEGLKINAISWLNPDSKEKLTISGENQGMAKHLPADTLMMTSGDSFQQVWQDYQKGVETQLLLPFSPKELQSNFTQLTGLNFEEQFLPWMTGNFVAGVVPTKPDSAKDAGVVFMVETRDKTAAEQALRELEIQMQEKYSLQMVETKMNDRSVVVWRLPPNLPVASRGWLEDKVLFFTMFSPITERIVEGADSLSANPKFQSATQSDLSPQSGQFFLEVPQLTQFMTTSQFLPKLTPKYQKYAKEFEAVGGTSTNLNDWSTRYDVQVHFLKKP